MTPSLRRILPQLVTKLDELFLGFERLRFAALDATEERALGLATLVADGSEVAAGFVAEAQTALSGAQRALGPPLDLESVRLLVGDAKDNFLEAVERLAELREQRLEQVGAEGRELTRDTSWAPTVHAAFDQARDIAWEVVPSLLRALEEIAERAASAGVSVQTTSIGQQVNVADELEAASALAAPFTRNPGGQR